MHKKTTKKPTSQSYNRTHTFITQLVYIARTHTHTHTCLKHKMWVHQALCELPLGCAPVQCEVLMCLDSHISTLGETRKCTHTHTRSALQTVLRFLTLPCCSKSSIVRLAKNMVPNHIMFHVHLLTCSNINTFKNKCTKILLKTSSDCS